MDRLRSKLLLALGWFIILFGLALGPLPGPGGIPIVAGGAMLVLSQSHSARKQFIRVQKKYPKFMGPIRRFMTRNKNGNSESQD